MRPTRILESALALVAVAAIAVPAAASASGGRSSHERQLVGRVTSVSSTSLTVGGTSFQATTRQLAGVTAGQCVEIEAVLRSGSLRVSQLSREDRCAATAVNADDPANHEAGDDRGHQGANDDRAGHDAGDDRSGHGSGHDD